MSNYILYTDKSENFECIVDIKGASTKDAIARIIVESDRYNLVFGGKIENNKCVVPIKKLKGILDENSTGNMKLEIVVEDTYFVPWKSQFIVKEEKNISVSNITEQKTEAFKPMVSVKVTEKPIVQPKPIEKPVEQIKESALSKFNEILKKKNEENKNTTVIKIAESLSKVHKIKGITLSNIEKRISDSEKIFNNFFTNNKKFESKKKEIYEETLVRL